MDGRHRFGPPGYSDRVSPALRQIHQQLLREVPGTVDLRRGAKNTGHSVTVIKRLRWRMNGR